MPARVALVTGAARRIGAAIARALHARGLAVAIHYRRSRAAAEALGAELEAARPGSTALLGADLLEDGAPQRLVEATCARLGGLDVLVNNASTFHPTPLATIDAAAWDDLMGTNLRAPLLLAQAAAEPLAARGGAIVNLADLHGLRPLRDHLVYSCAKAGLVMLTRALAVELAPAVRVNALAPGAILWPEGGEPAGERREAIIARTPLARLGRPEEVAAAVVFLACDATFTTGALLPVDGGRLA